LIPLRTSKYEIQSFDKLGSHKTPIILNECNSYEEWVYKWCAHLISKIDGGLLNTISAAAGSVNSASTSVLIDLTNSNMPQQHQQQHQQLIVDKELRVFPKLQFIIRFNVNVALFILPHLIIKMLVQNVNNEVVDQIFDEMMSVIQLNQLKRSTTTTNAPASAPIAENSTTSKRMLKYHHICCQTVFNIYDHLVRQLNYYRTKTAEIQSILNSLKSKNKQQQSGSGRSTLNSVGEKQASNELLLSKYKTLYDLFGKFIQRIPQQLLSRAAFECKVRMIFTCILSNIQLSY
jgi:hypothetical protein